MLWKGDTDYVQHIHMSSRILGYLYF